MLAWMWRKKAFTVEGMKTGTATVEISVAVPQEAIERSTT